MFLDLRARVRANLLVFALGLGVAAAFAGGVTLVSAHGGDNATTKVHACVGKGSGIVRIVGPTGSCLPRLETAMHWSIEGGSGAPGPQGSPGPQGTPGATGVQGTAGPAYVSLATDGARRAFFSVTNITINGVKVMGDVAPGATVTLEFDWNLAEDATNRQMGYVGFDGEPGVCIIDAIGNHGGTDRVLTLTAPSTPGAHRISLLHFSDAFCPARTMPVEPEFGSTAAVIAVRDTAP